MPGSREERAEPRASRDSVLQVSRISEPVAGGKRKRVKSMNAARAAAGKRKRQRCADLAERAESMRAARAAQLSQEPEPEHPKEQEPVPGPVPATRRSRRPAGEEDPPGPVPVRTPVRTPTGQRSSRQEASHLPREQAARRVGAQAAAHAADPASAELPE